MIQLPVKYFDSNHTGNIQARIHQDTNQLNGVLGHNIIQLFILPVSGLISFIYLSFIHLPMAVIALLLGLSILLVSKFYGFMLRINGIEIQNNWAKLTQQLQEALADQLIIKTFRIENAVSKRYAARNDEFLTTQINLS